MKMAELDHKDVLRLATTNETSYVNRNDQEIYRKCNDLCVEIILDDVRTNTDKIRLLKNLSGSINDWITILAWGGSNDIKDKTIE